MPLIIVVAGIALLLLLTIKIKLNTFVSLIIVSIAVAIASGMDLSKVVTSVESGRRYAGPYWFDIWLRCYARSLAGRCGWCAANSADHAGYFGKNKLDWAVVCSAFIVSIALLKSV